MNSICLLLAFWAGLWVQVSAAETKSSPNGNVDFGILQGDDDFFTESDSNTSADSGEIRKQSYQKFSPGKKTPAASKKPKLLQGKDTTKTQSSDTTVDEMGFFKADLDSFDIEPSEVSEERVEKKQKTGTPTIGSTRYTDTTLQDNYYFIGMHDSSGVIFHFAFKRKSYGGGNNGYDGRFTGILEWKGKWCRLEPLDYPVSVFSKRLYPEHPAFDFKWPTHVSHGEFLYHYNRFYLSVIFKQLQPLVRIANQSGHQSEMFIANAHLQGHNHEIPGLLLYHRIRLKAPHLFPHELREQEGLNEGPSKFFFLNAPGGVTYLGWSRYPFPGKGPEKFCLQIQSGGPVRSSRREVDFLVTEADSGKFSRFQKRWSLFLPPLGFSMDLKSRSYSKRWDDAVYYGINGTAVSSGGKFPLHGLLVDTRTEFSDTATFAGDQHDKKTKWWKTRQNQNQFIAARNRLQKNGTSKRVLEDMNQKKMDEVLKQETAKKWWQFWKKSVGKKSAAEHSTEGAMGGDKKWWQFWKKSTGKKSAAEHSMEGAISGDKKWWQFWKKSTGKKSAAEHSMEGAIGGDKKPGQKSDKKKKKNGKNKKLKKKLEHQHKKKRPKEKRLKKNATPEDAEQIKPSQTDSTGKPTSVEKRNSE